MRSLLADCDRVAVGSFTSCPCRLPLEVTPSEPRIPLGVCMVPTTDAECSLLTLCSPSRAFKNPVRALEALLTSLSTSRNAVKGLSASSYVSFSPASPAKGSARVTSFHCCLFGCSLLSCSIFSCSLFSCSLFSGSLFSCNLFSGSLFSCSLFG